MRTLNMQIKSWMIAILGFIATPLVLSSNPPFNDATETILMTMVWVAIPTIISVLLLYFERTRKWGAILSILIGIGLSFFLFAYGVILSSQSEIHKRIVYFLPASGIFLIAAGAYYFWKKV